jgi:hypothetical protein
LTHSNVRKSKPKPAGVVIATIIGLLHFAQGRPPIMFSAKWRDDSDKGMGADPLVAGA